MNKLNCDTSEYTNPLGGKVKVLEKETTGLKTSLAIVTNTVSQLIADKAGSASLAQKVIDSAKTKTESMSFGEALEKLKQGSCVARKGWNGKNQFVYLIGAREFQTGLHYGFGEYVNEPTFVDALAIHTTKNEIQVGWLASQTDMLSHDWYILGEEE